MRLRDHLLPRALRQPAELVGWPETDLDLLVRQARAAGLLGRLGARLREQGLHARLPAPVWRHFQAMLDVAERQRIAVRWEARHLSEALRGLDSRVLLLKGAAYAAAGLAPAAGRTFADIDILVHKSALPDAEKRLLLTGWITPPMSAYDERYYRRWMHELPPMKHLWRGTSLDLHHNLLPETARLKTDPALVLDAAEPLPGLPNLFIPCAADRILHSATHLYHEGEWGHGLRDLSDLDGLLRESAATPDFWPELTARATRLGLTLPLGYALRHCAALLDTPIPAGVSDHLPAPSWRASFMDGLFLRAMGLAHASLQQPGARLAGRLLYIRSHWLRMPPHLLLPHLAHKALAREPEPGARNPVDAQAGTGA